MDMIELECDVEFEVITDNDSLEQIYKRYFRKVYNYIRTNVKSNQDAEDLTGTVFERVVSKMGTYCPDKGGFEVWLFAIAHHVLIDHSRKKSRDKSIGMENIEEIVHEEMDLSVELISKDHRQVLFRALERLDDRERVLIALKFWSGLKNREIAQLTRLTDENVGVLVFRSIKKLKKVLEEMGVGKLYE